MAANDVATPPLKDRSLLEAVRAHIHDQVDNNSHLKELLETLDNQANTSSTLKGLLEDLEAHANDSSTLRTMLDRVAISDAEFKAKLALIEESHVLIKREQDLQAARIEQSRREYESDFQIIIDQMERANKDVIAANERYQKVLQFIDATLNHQQSNKYKDFGFAKTDLSPLYCKLSLSRGRLEPDPISVLEENADDFFNVIDKYPERLTICDVTDSIAEHCKAYLESTPGTSTSTPLQMISSPKSSSSLDSSSFHCSVNATPRFGMKGSKAVTEKPLPFVPRLDLSRTGLEPRAVVGVGVGARVETTLALSKIQQNPSHSACEQFENLGRRTSRRTDSARLISMTDADDCLGSSTDSARMMLSRIKRRAKGASCGGEASGPIKEVNVTSVDDKVNVTSVDDKVNVTSVDDKVNVTSVDDKVNVTSVDDKVNVTSVDDKVNVVLKKPFEEVVQSGINMANDLRCEPSILELVETANMQSINESSSMEIPYKDEAHQFPMHKPRRSISPSISKINPVLEMPMSLGVIIVDESTPMKAKEKFNGDLATLQTSRQEKKIQILLWSTGEKLLTLKTLKNTMFLWEDNSIKFGSFTSTFSDESIDLVLISLIAAKESQRRLFDSLDRMQGISKRGICCNAVRELVRAYPPERLVPTSFINDHFVAKFLQQTVTDESCLKLVSAATLRNSQDSEAAEFWQALVHHVASVADHKMATIEESTKDFAEVLLHEMREADIVGNAKLARFELKSFLTRCCRMERASSFHIVLPKDGEHDTCSNELLPISDTTRTYISSAPSQTTEEFAFGRQVRDITVMHGNKSELPLVATKQSRKLSLSILSSLKFWKRKPQKIPATDIDFFSMLNLDQSTDRLERSQRHIAKQYGFSLKI